MEKKLIKLIKDSGSYFKKDYDEQNEKIMLDEEARAWYQENMGIQNDDFFMKFYNFVGTPPLGNGTPILPLDEIFENSYIKENFIVIAEDELSISVYIKESGEIINYDFLYSHEDLDSLKNENKRWSCFYDFLKEFYDL